MSNEDKKELNSKLEKGIQLKLEEMAKRYTEEFGSEKTVEIIKALDDEWKNFNAETWLESLKQGEED